MCSFYPTGRNAYWLGKMTFTFSIIPGAPLSPGSAFVAICSLTTGTSSSSLSRICRLRLPTFLTGESASCTPFCTFSGLFAGLKEKSAEEAIRLNKISFVQRQSHPRGPFIKFLIKGAKINCIASYKRLRRTKSGRESLGRGQQ